jgi:hypothetical protein
MPQLCVGRSDEVEFGLLEQTHAEEQSRISIETGSTLTLQDVNQRVIASQNQVSMSLPANSTALESS